MTDVLTPSQRSYNMSQIRSKNTGPEKLVFEKLDDLGLCFQKHYPLVSKPDVVFPEHKIALFVDGEFWHGKYLNKIKGRLSPYWIEKITNNKARDRKNRAILRKNGWTIVRIWDDDLKKDPDKEINKLLKEISEKKTHQKIKDTNKSRFCLFSFFSGIGFLDLGFENAGFSVDFVNELVPSFLRAYKYARKDMDTNEPEFGYYQGGINELVNSGNDKKLQDFAKSARKKGKVVGFIAGPPCPDFSVGGKNRGKNGERGRLSATYIEIIKIQNPDFFVFENVRGLFRTKKHREFYDQLKKDLHKKDYITTERLINALEYGAPQDRERIILIGFKRSLLKTIGFNLNKSMNELPEGAFPWNRFSSYRKDAIFSLPWPSTDRFIENSRIKCPREIIPELTVEHWFKQNSVKNHPNSVNCFTPKAGLVKFKSIDEGSVSKKSFKRLHRWRYSPTVAYGNNEVHLHPYKPRRINAAEALALQSLPKEFELPPGMTLTEMFKAIGNGVPFLAANAIAKSISDFIGDSK